MPANQPSRRVHLTLTATDGAALERYAERMSRPPATVAAQLVMEAVQRGLEPGADETTELRERVARLTSERDHVRRQLREQRERDAEAALGAPRYEWPMERLLADGSWWDRWLPRLTVLLGRRSWELDRFQSRLDFPVRDQVGYADVLTFLLPDLPPAEQSQAPLHWAAPTYEARARSLHERTGERAWLELAETWDPVVRHVATALCLLERTGQPESDPYLRLRAGDEIGGPWLRVLGTISGQRVPEEMPRDSVKTIGERQGQAAARQQEPAAYP